MHAYFDTQTIDGRWRQVLCISPDDAEQCEELSDYIRENSSDYRLDGGQRPVCNVSIIPIEAVSEAFIKSKLPSAVASGGSETPP